MFAFACGSSSVAVVTRVGHDARWLVLAALLAVVAAAGRGDRLGLPPAVPVAAGAFVALALVSALWSVAPRLSVERAASLGLLFAAALLLADAVRGRAVSIERLLLGLLGGATAVGIAGLVMLLVAHGDAVEAASLEAPARFRGFGQNPNTASLLFALAVPVALWAALSARTRPRQALFAAALALLAGSIVASGSHGALVAGAVGALAPALARTGLTRSAAFAVAAVGAALAVGAVIQTLPQPSNAASTPAVAHSGPAPKPGYLNAEASYPLDADIGRPLPGGGEPPLRRSFVATSGRSEAWAGAIHQAAQRPLLGFGFGTEARVFVDRYYRFFGGLPENSYIGIALQLGIVGLAALLALVAVLVVRGRAGLSGPRRDLAAACLGVLAAGLAMAVVQSYLYSVGNIASATFWICAFLLPAVAARASDG